SDSLLTAAEPHHTTLFCIASRSRCAETNTLVRRGEPVAEATPGLYFWCAANAARRASSALRSRSSEGASIRAERRRSSARLGSPRASSQRASASNAWGSLGDSLTACAEAAQASFSSPA